MKTRILGLFLIFISLACQAQVNFGGNSLSSPIVSVEFGENNATNGYRGVVVPWIIDEVAVSDAQEGTIIFDLSTAKLKVKKVAAGWEDLTQKNISDVVVGITNNTVDSSLQDSLNDLPNARVYMGSTDPSLDTTPGVLVLGDNDKAMILPMMDSPHLNIKNPAAGMLAYDTLTNQLAVFNGTVWTFWKP